MNCSKNNRLPDWDKYFQSYADYHYYLYKLLFKRKDINETLLKQFNKCKKNNLNAVWATEKLYVPGNSKTMFKNILHENVRSIYNSALLQQYDIWEC